MPQTASIRPLAEAPPSVLHWAIESPADGRAIDVASGALRVQGWLLCKDADASREVLVRPAGDPAAAVRHFPFDIDRPDIVERVLGEPAGGHAQRGCGFRLQMPVASAPFDIGFAVGSGAPFWVATVAVREGPQVIEGPDGWLFLDNDSNRSVDQYTGVLRLDAAALKAWQAYLAESRALASRVRARHAIVVAPTKEEVLRGLYPHARAQTTVLDQVRALMQPRDHFVDAASVLSAHPDPKALFKRTDTHWTDRGAMLTTLAVIDALGFETGWARVALAKDRYRVTPFAGDLGMKLTPARTAPTEFLDAPPPEADAVFDNGLPEVGRVLVYHSPHAPFDARLLLFGASSGYMMLAYLKRLFRRVVFVASAAAIDPAIVQHEWPDALLLQSNGRFLIQPPRSDFSLREAVAARLAKAPEGLRRRVAGLLAHPPGSALEAPYVEMLKG